MRELVRYLLERAYIDFQGEISMDKVREFLREDDSREARALLSKLIDDKGVDDLLITIADCLKDHIRVGITEDTLREQDAVRLTVGLSSERSVVLIATTGPTAIDRGLSTSRPRGRGELAGAARAAGQRGWPVCQHG